MEWFKDFCYFAVAAFCIMNIVKYICYVMVAKYGGNIKRIKKDFDFPDDYFRGRRDKNDYL